MRALATRVGLALIAATCLAPLAACADDSTAVADATWQVTDVYTTPGTPSAVDDSVAGAVELGFGGKSVTGFSGCSPLAGMVAFTDESGAAAAPEDATHATFSQMQFRPIDESQCTGRVRYIHDALVDLLYDGTFSIRHEGSGEMVLQEDKGDADPRAIRLVSVG